jgi:SAM-dependent methyltransferase
MMDSEQARTARTFDAYKDTYSRTIDESVAFTGLSTDFFTRVKAGYILDLVRRKFGASDKVSALDIGCGIGNYHGLLAPYLGKLSGVDVSSESIEVARRRDLPVSYDVYDGTTLPYGDGCFDLAFAICVVHHVPQALWNVFASEMRRVLKSGGLALVFEHNPRNPLTMRVVNSCPFDADAVLLRSETAQSLLLTAGFRQVHSGFILSIPAANAWLRRIDRIFSSLPFGAQYYVSATA